MRQFLVLFCFVFRQLWVPGGPGKVGLGVQRLAEAVPDLERASVMEQHAATDLAINP